MTERARARGRFLKEAIWSRFLPAYVQLQALVADGRTGEVRMVTGSFGFRAPFDPEHRLFAPALGGGALLDGGLYPVQLALMLLGEPERVSAIADIGVTGVDARRHADGRERFASRGDSRALARTLDRARAQVGLVYPCE